MLTQLNKTLNKMMPVITPTSVILGIILSSYIQDFRFLVPWLFAFMTFEGSLSMNFSAIKNAVLHPFPVFAALIFLHIIMPLYALGIGNIAFHGDTYTTTGLVLGMVIPTGITSFIWVAIHKGNSALTLAIILIDAMLSPFIVPLTLSLIVGQQVELDVLSMMSGLVYMIVLPSIAAMILNELTKGKIQKVWKPRLAPISKLFLGIVVALNGAIVAPYLAEVHIKLVFIALVVLFISFSGYLFAFLMGLLLKRDKETTVALLYSCGMRNISAGSVIAMQYFPSAVVAPVVLGMLFQQIIASIFGNILERYYSRRKRKNKAA